MQEAWFGRGWLIDVLHSTLDAFGYDVVLQKDNVIRHVQPKAKRKGGSTSTYNISTQVIAQPAGCVICIIWEPDPDEARMRLGYRWFGSGPSQQLPELGDKFARHSRGDAQGVKRKRVNLRIVKLCSFTQPMGIAELLGKLFGEV